MMQLATETAPPVGPTRQVRLGSLDAEFIDREDGSLLVRPGRVLSSYARRITERLEYWAATAPERSFIARREGGGEWRRIGYAEALAKARAIGAALVERGLSAERPVAILSGNDIDHAMMALACLHVGVPYAPISVAYSLISTDHSKLHHIFELLTPGLVFCADGQLYAKAIAAVVPADIEVVTVANPAPGRKMTLLADLLAAPVTPALDAAVAAVGPDTIAKFLFTSGSTGLPKGVINTQRMLCSNQMMLLEAFPFMANEPPVIIDWLPWSHTFGGNHNVGLVLYNGGTLYIDDGKPTPAGIGETLRNLREIAPTVYFNVPKGYEELVREFDRQPDIARMFFSRVKLLFYASAGLAQHVWDSLDRIAIETVGERIAMMTGLGATETAPFAICTRPDCAGSGIVGLPAPGVELKLVPVQGKMEGRVRGPNIMPGYWRNPTQTAGAFDEEGFYKFGDALCFVDADDRQKGFRFDGRISEDFKLATGTWVSVGPMRAKLMQRLGDVLRDVVIAGIDRDFVSILVIPDTDRQRALGEAGYHAALRQGLIELAGESTGSSTRVARALVLTEPLSIDAGEVTDKGSINQRAVLSRRKARVDQLYGPPGDPAIIGVD